MNGHEPIRRQLLQQLESLRAAGVQTLPKGSGNLVLLEVAAPPSQDCASGSPSSDTPRNPPVKKAAASTAVESSIAPSISSDYGQVIPADQRMAALEVIQAEVAKCRACPELCDSRTQTVFGVGNPNARLCFVGEGPGADEDRVGEPFVGAAGQLLTKILGACNLSRDDVYILNTVKCRPPGNRNPQEIELNNCWPFAIRQLEVIQPEFICCLGSVAARTVLQTKLSISKLRGQFHPFRNSRVVVTYHPAYLLRTPTAKKHTWNDMKMLMAEMGVEL